MSLNHSITVIFLLEQNIAKINLVISSVKKINIWKLLYPCRKLRRRQRQVAQRILGNIS